MRLLWACVLLTHSVTSFLFAPHGRIHSHPDLLISTSCPLRLIQHMQTRSYSDSIIPRLKHIHSLMLRLAHTRTRPRPDQLALRHTHTQTYQPSDS
eukprot:4977333-Pyramimonas_sp.AAC.1